MAIPTTIKTNTLAEFIDNANLNANNLGDLTTLTTTDKSSAVAAINEIKSTSEENSTKAKLYAILL